MHRFFIKDSICCTIQHNNIKYKQIIDNIDIDNNLIDKNFIDDISDVNKSIIEIIKEDDVRHITKVLRLNIGQNIEIVDIDARLFVCKLIQVDTDGVFCVPVSEIVETGESCVNITLYQGIPKGEKFDFIIQKSIELGVNRIVPVLFDRCVVKWKDDKSSIKKHTRWNRIAYEAAKQSKRCYIPKVEIPITVDELIKELMESSQIKANKNSDNLERLNILFYEEESNIGLKDKIVEFKQMYKLKNESINKSTNDFSKKIDNNLTVKNKENNNGVISVSAIVGAEGGLEQYEVKKLKNAGAKCVSLGKRILRTETAGIITVALLQYELGDLGNA